MNNKISQKIICLVGEPSSGKGAVVRILQENKFTLLSLSDEVVSYTKTLGFENIPRAQISQLANEARQKNGPDFFARPIVQNEDFLSAPLLVIDSIRNLAEIALIRDSVRPNISMKFWSLQADPELRFARTLARRYSWDPLTFEEFKANDLFEQGLDGNTFNQQNAACIAEADIHIWNNGTLEELKKEVNRHLQFFGIGIEGKNGMYGKET